MATVQVGRLILVDPTLHIVQQIQAAVSNTTFPWNDMPGGDITVYFTGLPRLPSGSLAWGYCINANAIRVNPFLGSDRMQYALMHEVGHVVDRRMLTPNTRAALKALMSPSAVGVAWRGDIYAARPGECFGDSFSRAYLPLGVLNGWYDRQISDLAALRALVADPIPGGTDPDDEVNPDDPEHDDFDEDRDPHTGLYNASLLATIQILYDGDDITPYVRFGDARFVSQAGAVPGEAQIRVKDEEHVFAPGYFHVGGTLELYINGRREWDGWAMVVGREWAFPVDNTEDPGTTPRYWVLEGYDRNFLFTRRFHYDLADPVNFNIGDYPAGAIDRDVVLDVLANYTSLQDDGLDIVAGITEVGPIDPYEKINVLETGMSWQRFMQKIALYNGAISYIDPDRVVRYVDDTTDTAPFALSDQPDEGEIGYREMVIRFSANEMSNEAFVWGVGVGSDEPAFAHVIDEAAVAEHGRFQYGETEQGMYATRSVLRRADTLINGSPTHARGHKEDVVRIECAIFQPGLRVGVGVSFHSGAWDFGDPTFDPGDLVDTPGSYDKSTEFERLLIQIGKIESNNTYTRQNKRSFAYGRWQVMPGNWRVWGPLALGLPRSVGVAARDIDPANWYPPVTPANQDTVVRWRMGQMYRNKGGDPRRVAASWRSGASVGARDPSTWSRGTLLYVNHACVPLGYPAVTYDTVLDPLTEPGLDYTDYQSPNNSDDVYPVRKIQITFPTPTSVRYDLMLSHSYDEAWAWRDPLPPVGPGEDPDPTGYWYSEVITLDGYPGIDEPQPPDSGYSPGNTFSVSCRGWAARGVAGHNYFDGVNTQWAQDGAFSKSDQIEAFQYSPGVHSAVGYPLQNILYTVPMNSCGDDAWTNWEDCERWYGPISANLAKANLEYPLELVVAGSPQLIAGHVPSVRIGLAHDGPEDNMASGSSSYGSSSSIGSCVNLSGDAIAYPADWATRYGFPAMEAEFSTLIIPVGSLLEGDWITVSPGWSCQRLTFPQYWCDTGAEAVWGSDPIADAANNRGPYVSGMGASGRFSGTGLASVTLIVKAPLNQGSGWQNTPAAGVQNGPQTMWVDGMYRTLYPYAPNTLEVTWQGVLLTRGVEVIEVDPARGLFQIAGVGSGEGAITLRYWVPANSDPTDPIPGEPPTDHEPIPEPGTSGATAIEAVIAQAYSMIGTPYQLGAESRVQADCSGLMYRIFTDAGVGELIGTNRKVVSTYVRWFADRGMFSRNFASAQRGDMVIYTDNGVRTSHMGIYLGSGLVISALVNPYGTTKHKLNGIGQAVYGVCMVPFDRARTSSDTTDVEDGEPEIGQTPDGDLPPQDPPSTQGIVYRPRSQTQLGWGTESDGVNGLMACSAMLLDRHTLGSRNDVTGSPLSTPPAHRTATGVDKPRDQLTLSDVSTAWSSGWGETLVTSVPLSWQTFKAEIVSGRGAIVLGTNRRALYVNEQLPDGSFWVCDPIARGARLYTESDLKAFANALWEGDDVVTCAFSRRTPTL